MIEVPSPADNNPHVLAIQTYSGLHLEPPTRDVVSAIELIILSREKKFIK